VSDAQSLSGDLLAAAVAGDARAYTTVVQRAQRAITAIALSIVRDVPASEDIAQEAFLRCWRDRTRLRNPDSLLPWLREVTRNLARDHLRAAAQRLPTVTIESQADLIVHDAPAAASLIDAEAERRILREAIDELPEDSRETLLLYFREGEDHRAVAALLGLEEATVRQRISRARRSLCADLLARLSSIAVASAPTAGFAASIGASLLAASAPAAAGVAFGVSAAGAAGGKGLGHAVAAGVGGVLAGIGVGLAGALLGVRLRGGAAGDDACIRLAASWFAISSSVLLTAGIVRFGAGGSLQPVTFAVLFVASLACGALFARFVPWLMVRRGYRPGNPSRRSMAMMWMAIAAGVGAGALGYFVAQRLYAG
jgi:RNA polymerase sigma factor (sigma-70 family)